MIRLKRLVDNILFPEKNVYHLQEAMDRNGNGASAPEDPYKYYDKYADVLEDYIRDIRSKSHLRQPPVPRSIIFSGLSKAKKPISKLETVKENLEDYIVERIQSMDVHTAVSCPLLKVLILLFPKLNK